MSPHVSSSRLHHCWGGYLSPRECLVDSLFHAARFTRGGQGGRDPRPRRRSLNLGMLAAGLSRSGFRWKGAARPAVSAASCFGVGGMLLLGGHRDSGEPIRGVIGRERARLSRPGERPPVTSSLDTLRRRPQQLHRLRCPRRLFLDRLLPAATPTPGRAIPQCLKLVRYTSV